MARQLNVTGFLLSMRQEGQVIREESHVDHKDIIDWDCRQALSFWVVAYPVFCRAVGAEAIVLW